MTPEHIFLITSDAASASQIQKQILEPAGFAVTIFREAETARSLIRAQPPDLVLIGECLDDRPGLDLVSMLQKENPALPAVFLLADHTDTLGVIALRAGATDFWMSSVSPKDAIASIDRCLERRKNLDDWIKLQSRKNTKSLEKRLESLDTLQRIGRSINSSLDLNSVLTSVVDAAVELTEAEEGSLLLLDEHTGELYMHANRNFQEDFARTFRIPIQDTLPGQVLKTGKPLVLNQEVPQKIKTSYLVYTLIYVPLMVEGRPIGVLGVDHRQGRKQFTDEHLMLLSTLSDYAAIAIVNANLYSKTEVERNKLEAILTQVEDGVLVTDFDGRVILINQTAREVFQIADQDLRGKNVQDIIQHTDLLEIFTDQKRLYPSRNEITLQDGRVFNAQVTPIPEVGLAITMQDITHLKELDRIKSEFVSTVSHDLRSPLTAILGYVELIDRVGPTNDVQREFIRRVQFSVNNITALINDLLDLGRIEAGHDSQKEIVPLGALLQYSIDGLRSRTEEKQQALTLSVDPDLPNMLGNPTRLRQMISNLIGNAIKYTQPGGKIDVRATVAEGQLIFEISDNGPGIPPGDQPFIFDKFFRGSNVNSDTQGTGLGLAIVKSIVENHQGRIWMSSTLGAGTCFTVVLPVEENRD